MPKYLFKYGALKNKTDLKRLGEVIGLIGSWANRVRSLIYDNHYASLSALNSQAHKYG